VHLLKKQPKQSVDPLLKPEAFEKLKQTAHQDKIFTKKIPGIVEKSTSNQSGEGGGV
jgi:hypothetical protein